MTVRLICANGALQEFQCHSAHEQFHYLLFRCEDRSSFGIGILPDCDRLDDDPDGATILRERA